MSRYEKHDRRAPANTDYNVCLCRPGTRVDKHVGRFASLAEARREARRRNRQLTEDEGVPTAFSGPFAFYYVRHGSDSCSALMGQPDDAESQEAS